MQAVVHHNSSHSSLSAPIPPVSLSPAQAQVVAALAQGLTVSAAARQAGVHRTTIHHWRRNEPEFSAAVENAQREYAAVLSDEMRELAATALKTLQKLLESPDTRDFVRLKTALAVLERPHFPEPGWHSPVRIDSRQKHGVIGGSAEIKAGHQAMRMAGQIEARAKRIDPGQGIA